MLEAVTISLTCREFSTVGATRHWVPGTMVSGSEGPGDQEYLYE